MTGAAPESPWRYLLRVLVRGTLLGLVLYLVYLGVAILRA